MTTKITVKTHDWPVRVTVSDQHNFNDAKTGAYRYGHATEGSVVAKNSQQSFYITDTRSISFSELPVDWTPESEGGQIGCANAASDTTL